MSPVQGLEKRAAPSNRNQLKIKNELIFAQSLRRLPGLDRTGRRPRKDRMSCCPLEKSGQMSNNAMVSPAAQRMTSRARPAEPHPDGCLAGAQTPLFFSGSGPRPVGRGP
jgi:hypothetical protein